MNDLNSNELEKSDSMTGVIYKELRDRICTRYYEKGRILKESDIADEFNVSRTPVREAFQRLKMDELVESRKKLGTTVLGLDADIISEMYAVRIALLDFISSESDVPFNEKHIAVMNELLKRINTMHKEKKLNEYWPVNDMLHENLCSVVQNRYLRSLSTKLYMQTARSWAFFLPRNWDFSCDILRREVEQERDLMLVGYLVGVFCALKSFTILSKAKCELIEAEYLKEKALN